MKEELKSMDKNHVWTLVQPSLNAKPIGCKWVYKTKRDSKGKIERLKARLMAKGFTQREGFEYIETFSPASSKDSFRIIMAHTTHFNLELHQVDVRPTFLNGDLHEEIFMQQPLGFVERGMESMVCILNKSIYGLKQASRQWYLKFDKVITTFGFAENKFDECIYLKVCTIPYLAFVVSVLGRFQANPREPHWVAAKKVLRYFQGTKSHMLIYSKVEKLEIVAYTDSDLAGCTDDIKYTACYAFVLAGCAVSWKIWIKNFITKVRIVDSIVGPLKIYCDNEAVVFFSRNNKRTPASELMEIKYLLVKDKVKEHVIDVIHIGIESMVADPLTKPLPVRVFKIHVAKMGVH
ncbi:unnamed protein product [Prunus armeniaca]